MKVYKIRRKSDGLYSTGGTAPRWSKTGKTWNAIGHLKNHLNLFHPSWSGDEDTTARVYGGCEIITYELETRIIEAERQDVV